MKARFAPLALIAALLLAFGVFAVACDGSSDNTSGELLTIEEYFQRHEALSHEVAERGGDVQAQFADEAESADSQEERFEPFLEAYQDFVNESLTIFTGFVDGIRDLDPPAELADAHKEFVEAGDDNLAAAQNLVDQVEAVESEADFDALSEDGNAAEAGIRFNDACLALQDIADENGIDVDLACDDVEDERIE